MSNFQSKKTLEFIRFYIDQVDKGNFYNLEPRDSWFSCLEIFDYKLSQTLKLPYLFGVKLKLEEFFEAIDNVWFRQEVQEEDLEDE